MKKQTKKCKTCKKTFEKKINCSKKSWEKAKFCSNACVNVGRPAWNKGIGWSEEWKKKKSEQYKGKCFNTGRTHIKKGQRLSPKTEFKKGVMPKTCFKKGDPRITGANNRNWKGGVTPEHLKIRWSQDMKNWRKKVFERDSYTCQECGIKGGWDREKKIKITLNADHIKPFATHPDLRLDLDNGRTLCLDCHKKTPSYGVNV
jgi:hypothetical protein